MEYDELKKQLSEYNWDDGFDVPFRRRYRCQKCALKIF